MKVKAILIILVALFVYPMTCDAQLYTGMSGLIKNPSAEMNEEGDAVIAGYFLNKHFTPGEDKGFAWRGKKYDTFDFSVSLTPFRWIEIGYTFTLMKTIREGDTKLRFNHKDRYFSVKLNPIRESKYIPAIAIGTNDPISSSGNFHRDGADGSGYFASYYIVATKHFAPAKQTIGVNLGYRYVPKAPSKRWQGVICGLTWCPKWIPDLRAIAEWTGNEVNLGIDCVLWKHLVLQAAMVDCRYFTGGIAYKVNLF